MNEISEHLQKLIKDNLEASMGLKYEQIGAMEFYPAGKLSDDCPIIFIELVSLDLAFADMKINYDVAYNFRIVFVFKWADNDNPVLKKMEELGKILELLLNKFCLPDLDLADVQIIYTIPGRVELKPYEEEMLSRGSVNLLAVATTFRVETMTLP